MLNTNTRRPAVDMREIISSAAATCDVADYMIDGSYAIDDAPIYISDAIAEGADARTSIYYDDILAFISAHPEALAEVVAQGLYIVGGSAPYDLYSHGQAAECMMLSDTAYNHLDDIHHGIAAYYILHVHELKEIPADTWNEIKAAIDADQPDTYGDIFETVDAIISPDDEDDDGDYIQPLTVTAFDKEAM